MIFKQKLLARIPRYLMVTALSWIARAISIVCSLISLNLITSCLGIEDYSIYSILINIIGWSALLDLGLGYSLQNYITELQSKREDFSVYISTTLIILTIFFAFIIVLIFFLSPIISSWLFDKLDKFRSHELTNAFFISASIGIISIYGTITSKIYYGLHKGHIPNILLAISAILSLGFVILLKHFDNASISAIVFATMITPAVINLIPIINILKQRKANMKLFSLFCAKKLIKRGYSFAGFAVMSALVLQADYIVMSQNILPSEIVEYNFLFKLFSVIFIAYSTLLASLWPTFNSWRSEQKSESIIKTIKKYTLLGIISFIFFTVLMIFFGQKIANQLLNIKIYLSLNLIILFGIYFCVRVWTDMFAMVLQSFNQMKPFWIITPVQALVSITLQILLSKQLGVAGIVIAIIASFLLTVTWVLPIASFKRLKNQEWKIL